METKKYSRVLTIAGSDSGGGAGIQADLKTFSACGCFGMSAITAITSQNTVGVTAIHPIPVEHIESQLRAIFDDMGTDAVKIGMLHSSEVIHTVVRLLKEYAPGNIVVDPVMVATSGDKLLQDEAIQTLISELFPLATVITPNIPEAQIIAEMIIRREEEFMPAANVMLERGAKAVLLKAGHLSGDMLTDMLFTPAIAPVKYTSQRVKTANTHGTGCTLSSAIAAFLAKGNSLPAAIEMATAYIHTAIEAGKHYKIGNGHGPVHHFHQFWK